VKVYSALARAFAAEGVTDVFGLMGDGNMYWMDAMNALGVRVVQARHENAALSMAHGYERATGRVGVCTTTGGPGVTQLTTSMTIASRGGAGLVTFAGETVVDDVRHIHYIHAERVADAMECAFVRAGSAKTALRAVADAFYIARTESRPVLLSVPVDVQQATIDDALAEQYVPAAGSVAAQEQARARRLIPEGADVAEAAGVLAGAERVAIVVGRGALASGAGTEIVALADRLGAVLATTMLAKNWLADYPFYVGLSGNYGTRTARRLISEADCVLAVGTSLDQRTTGSGALIAGGKVVRIDTAAHARIQGRQDIGVYVRGDARTTLRALLDDLDARGHAATGFHTEEVRAALKDAYRDDSQVDIPEGLLDPRLVCAELDQIVPEDVDLILGSGQSAGFSAMLFNRPRGLVFPTQFFGSIGQGLTNAIGAIIGRQGRPCMVVDGDVSFMMYLAEFETAVRYGLPLLAVVLNDQSMSAEFHKMSLNGLDAGLAKMPTPELGQVAEAFGGRGVTARTMEELRAAARAFVDHPAPTIIDARISPDVVSIPYQREHYRRDV
jgi:acetolactate synthase-1/2/3 large subunit